MIDPTVSLASRFKLYNPEHVATILESSGVSNIPPGLSQYYQNMLLAGGERLLRSPASIDCLQDIDLLCPNFHEVSEEIRGALALAFAEGGPMQLPPILLLGKSGVGKTHYANELSKMLGLGFNYIPMSSVSAGSILGGAAQVWMNAGPGKVARTLIEEKWANPLILIDEIDKTNNNKGSTFNPIGPLYVLLESETAAVFCDEYIAVPIDARHITWIATANDDRDIPGPILNRLLPFFVREPNREEVALIARNLYKRLHSRYPRFDSDIHERIIEKLSEMTPRNIKTALFGAFGRAARAKRRHLLPGDIRLVGGHRSRMGF